MRLIDADALKKRIEEARQCFGPGGALSDANYFKAIAFELFGVLLGYIDEAQTLDAEPVRHAKWEHVRGVRADEIVQCSNPACRKETYAAAIFVRYGRYCPYCGARMDEEVR